MTSKSNNLINDALSVATAVAYTKKEVDKLNQKIDSLAEQKDIVEYVQGPAGEQGPRGFIGAKGDRGEQGPAGEKGERGDVGPRGLEGLIGPKGDRGEKGDVGPQGPQGVAGERGQDGADGQQGPAGEQGPKGERGDTGYAGADGRDGKDGINGTNGRDGVDGKNGRDGQDGKQGPKGDKGDRGEVGPVGVAGPKGDKGDKGDDGRDADIKPIEDKFKKFQDTVEKDLQQYKNRINASVSKTMANDAWKATGSGEVNLRYLDDVDRNSIQNGYILSYDEVTQKFTFVSPTAASFTPTDVTQVFAEVKNAESFTITKGQPVYLFGATGNKASVKLANNTGDTTSAKTLGLVYSSSITAGGTGYVITQGVVTGVDTKDYSEGDTLYLANTAGNLTSTKPYAPQHLVYIGVVERANQGQGQIYVRPQNGYELNEIHDVNINHNVALSNADILVYNTINSLWENRPVSYLGLSTSDALARTTANSAYSQANTATNLAQSAYDFANTIVSDTQIDPFARSQANSAFNQANTATSNAATANSIAVSAFAQANAGVAQASSALLRAIEANTLATNAFTRANTAYTQANTATTLAQSAYNYANTIVVPSLSGYATEVFVTSQGYLTSANLISYATTATTNTIATNVASAWSTANSAYTQANTATTNASTADTKAQSAYDKANTAITTSGGTVTGNVVITYQPTTTVGQALTINGANTQGGTGYVDFLKVTNTSGGATNPNKTFRLTSTGDVEIINSAYNANLFSLTNAGGLSVPGPISVGGKQAVNGPAFRAHVATGQAITSGSQQKVTFGTENFDTNNNFASSRFTPTIEGYYQFNATVRIDGTSSTGECMIILYKNGAEYARGHNQSGTEQGASFYSMTVSDIAYANGTGDYFEVYIQQTSGGNRNTTAGSPISYFSGVMVRGA